MELSLEPPRVLLIDDDESLLDALTQMLKLRIKEICVDVYDGALVALESATLDEYDAIISDIKMPGLDGLELLAKTREMCPDVPVLLITGHGETDLAIQALRADAFDLIRKPIDRDYLVARLIRAIEVRRLRQEVRTKQAALEKYSEELERRVQERTLELQRANQAKDEFLGLVSHELRTPLTVIVGNLDMLERHKLILTDQEKQQLNLDLKSQSQRLHRIIENLLVLARSEIGASTRTERVLLDAAIETQAHNHTRAFPERRISVYGAEGIYVQADPLHLDLILGNLLSNAEKYSNTKELIEISVSTRDDFAVVSVLDRGRGLPPDEADRIFEPFYRAREAGTLPGAGVGLTVCRRLLETQGGAIFATARDGGGSNFTFRLPLATSSLDGELMRHSERGGLRFAT